MAKEAKTHEEKLVDVLEKAQLAADAWEMPEYRGFTKRVAKAKKAQAREIAREDLSQDCLFAVERKLAQAKAIAAEVKAHPAHLEILDPAKAKAQANASQAATDAKAAKATAKADAKKIAILAKAVSTLQSGGTLSKKVLAMVEAATCAEVAPAPAPTDQPVAPAPAPEASGN